MPSNLSLPIYMTSNLSLLCTFGHQLPNFWHPDAPHHSLPSLIKWPDWNVSQSPDICLLHTPLRPQLLQKLPWVLLDIWRAPKEGLGYSSIEMVYGSPLTLAWYFVWSHSTQPDDNLQLSRLRDNVSSPFPICTSWHGVVPTSVPGELQVKFVFICCNAHCTPL